MCIHPKLINVCPSVTNTSLKNAQLARSNYDEAAVCSMSQDLFTWLSGTKAFLIYYY